jgi:hypothetical protein
VADLIARWSDFEGCPSAPWGADSRSNSKSRLQLETRRRELLRELPPPMGHPGLTAIPPEDPLRTSSAWPFSGQGTLVYRQLKGRRVTFR